MEVIFPSSDADGFVHKFLAKHGEGMHHMTFVVDDLPAEVARFQAAGHRIVDESFSDPQWQEAFVSPLTAHGTIIQLAQSDLDQAEQDLQWAERLEHVLEVAGRAGGRHQNG